MITNFETAQKINAILLEVSGILDESVGTMVDSDCPDSEKSKYMQIVGELLGIIGLDVLNLLYREHPQLKPEDYYLPDLDA
jgi:hypothetical protein